MTLDGLLTFFGSHHAIRADKVLREHGHAAALIPGPKDLSPNCGTAVRFVFAEREVVVPLLEGAHVEIDEIHAWAPRSDTWQKPVRRGSS